jgi:hypothetical protein
MQEVNSRALGFLDAGELVSTDVVHEYDVTSFQCRSEYLFD